MLSTENLALLEAIRETGSLSRAAAHLGKAPSTVSYAARQLEERFDALLFDRRRYRLQLTPAGELLVNEAARLMQDVARLTQRVRQVANGWESRLWIVTDELLEFETLIPVIDEFDALQSGVPLRITQEVLKGVVGSLLENGTLVEKPMADPREPNILYAGWRGDHDGRALGWWLEQLKKPFLATRLVEGTDRFI
ncbi:LysR family transcriptional regulator [Pseudomonas fluorescens]|uniref:HTH lysR-type domain-containing protein n=1 Tax=Pseudomonas fluorescens TaxID=294 RepID=A0A5E6XPC3_PSEFL|nr:LysR family transcriptional regulator [Pseudomonas fluorescens]VVN42577.1 hypothetical protein PS659_05547 [Pseudomonas fluorescens]